MASSRLGRLPRNSWTTTCLAAAALVVSLTAGSLGARSERPGVASMTPTPAGAVAHISPAAMSTNPGQVAFETPVPGGGGFWEVYPDGQVVAQGTARFYGDMSGVQLAKPIVGMAATPDGNGYWLVASDGGIFTFGDATFYGSGVGQVGASQATGIVFTPGGYYVLTASGQLLAFGAAPRLATTQTLAPSENPATSLTPSATFRSNCYGTTSSSACNSAALADIDQARAGEGLAPMVLPADFASLSMQAQLVDVANSERSARGLPTMADNNQLDALAAAGAQGGSDPTGPPGYSWGSNISWGYPTALAADFAWMYDDGPGGTNADCTAANSSGCWGHRDNILSPSSGQMGAASYDNNGVWQLAELFVSGF